MRGNKQQKRRAVTEGDCFEPVPSRIAIYISLRNCPGRGTGSRARLETNVHLRKAPLTHPRRSANCCNLIAPFTSQAFVRGLADIRYPDAKQVPPQHTCELLRHHRNLDTATPIESSRHRLPRSRHAMLATKRVDGR